MGFKTIMGSFTIQTLLIDSIETLIKALLGTFLCLNYLKKSKKNKKRKRKGTLQKEMKNKRLWKELKKYKDWYRNKKSTLQHNSR